MFWLVETAIFTKDNTGLEVGPGFNVVFGKTERPYFHRNQLQHFPTFYIASRNRKCIFHHGWYTSSTNWCQIIAYTGSYLIYSFSKRQLTGHIVTHFDSQRPRKDGNVPQNLEKQRSLIVSR